MLRITEPKGLHSFRHEAMATDFIVSFGGVDSQYAKQAAYEAFSVVDDIESKLSLYQESSDISRINLAEEEQSVLISSECVECLELALEASRLTSDKFQVFVGAAACAAKGFIPPHLKGRLEGRTKQATGEAIALDPRGRIVTRLRGDLLVDLGGIGKGFALDRMIETLEDWEIPIAALNSGGSTHLFWSTQGDAPWRVELNQARIGAVGSGAVASSGLGFQENHIIDPSTGQSRTLWRRSYVRSPSAGLADALSTAAMLMDWPTLEQLADERSDLSFAVEDAEGAVHRCGMFFARESGS